MNLSTHDLIIIGAGPAGLTCGLYAGRSRLKTVILEKMAPGGRLLLTETIENFPGFSGGIATADLVRRMQEQVESLGIKIEPLEALEVDCRDKSVKTPSKTYSAQAIIIASGAKPRRLNIPGEERLTGKGVSYCATCDAPLFKGKNILIVGGGNAVAEEALYLARFATSVNIIHRRGELRAAGILQEKLEANKKINFTLNSVVEEISGAARVESVRVKDVNTRKESLLACEGVFIYIGYEPDTVFLKDKVKMDEAGFIITDENMAASQEGIFACGDCRKKLLYQAITACADGAIAAESAYKYISEATT